MIGFTIPPGLQNMSQVICEGSIRTNRPDVQVILFLLDNIETRFEYSESTVKAMFADAGIDNCSDAEYVEFMKQSPDVPKQIFEKRLADKFAMLATHIRDLHARYDSALHGDILNTIDAYSDRAAITDARVTLAMRVSSSLDGVTTALETREPFDTERADRSLEALSSPGAIYHLGLDKVRDLLWMYAISIYRCTSHVGDIARSTFINLESAITKQRPYGYIPLCGREVRPITDLPESIGIISEDPASTVMMVKSLGIADRFNNKMYQMLLIWSMVYWHIATLKISKYRRTQSEQQEN